MNKIMLVGNVVKDSEIQFVGEKGIAKATFTLACNERLGKDKEMCNYVPCVIWGDFAESVVDYITKGTKLAISGRLDIKSVQDEEDEDLYRTYVSVNVADLDFCGSANKGDSESKKESKGKKGGRKEKTKR